MANVTSAERRLANLMEKDLRSIDSLSARTAKVISKQLRIALTKLIAKGGNSRKVDAILQSMQSAIVEAMLAAHLLSMRRVSKVMPKTKVRKGIAFSLYDSAIKISKRNLGLTATQIENIKRAYSMRVARTVGLLHESIDRRIPQIIQQVTEQSLSTRQAVKEIANRLESIGMSDTNPAVIETLFRTQTQLSYSAASWQSVRDDSDIDDILWGFKYVTVGDERVRPEHIALEGTTLPKDHEFWLTNYPPNGWNCRCKAIAIFQPREEVIPPSTIEIGGEKVPTGADKDFRFNPGLIDV